MLFKKLQHWFAGLSNWQRWPFYLFHLPIGYAWLVYFWKSRSLWFYTASNPTLAFGGFEGERKSNMYRQLPPEFCPRTLVVTPEEDFDKLLEKIAASGIRFPFIVKPDIGMKGILFRKIGKPSELEAYHARMPAPYLVQEWLEGPHEVSVFYCRYPGSQSGTITAMIRKDLLEVQGDGASSLCQLAAAHPLGAALLPRLQQHWGERLQEVVPAGETVCLSHIANLDNGARFILLTHLVTPQLRERFDRISAGSHFYYGRYDIKCRSIEAFCEGKDFWILEFNGAGSVPNHIYTGAYSLLGAYREILHHWNALYRISAGNRQRGTAYYGLRQGFRFLNRSRRYFRELKALDRELVLPG